MKNFCFLMALIIAPQISPHQYNPAIEGFYSQKGQDRFLYEHFFHNKHNGTFVEIGAHDGISFSNTYFFEKELGWNGVCVEPYQEQFTKLIKNRQCFCEKVCIADKAETAQFLKCTGYMSEMYSGLLNHYDPRHLDRINNELNIFGGSKEIIEIECCLFNEVICEKHGIFKIDLLSIDTEGSELAILKSINFEQVTIDIILVENNFLEDDIKTYLTSVGYTLIARIGKDDIFKYKDFTNE